MTSTAVGEPLLITTCHSLGPEVTRAVRFELLCFRFSLIIACNLLINARPMFSCVITWKLEGE